MFDLRDVLEAELKEKDRLLIAREDFAACRQSGQFEGKGQWDIVAASACARIFLARANRLERAVPVTDRIAERMNRPVFKVISDSLLLDIAPPPEKDGSCGPGAESQAESAYGGARFWRRSSVDAAPLVEREHAKRPSDRTLKRLEKLKSWRKKVAQEISVESISSCPRSI